MTHDERLKQFDEKLAELQRTTREVEEQRREYVNRHNLNKYMKG